MEQALTGLRVLELGRFISAPFASKLLGDYGAEVIKIEPPSGDESRRHGPFPGDIPHPERSGLFLNLNTNKLGVTLDVGTPTGRDILMELIKDADVLVENLPPAELARLNLQDATLRRVNPRLVTTSVTVFGDDGPNKDYQGHAITAAAASGFAYRMGDPRWEPLTTPSDRSDYWGAISAAGATMMALMARDLTGEGQHVDIAAAEVMGNIINIQEVFGYLARGDYPIRAGRRIRSNYPWVLMPVKDGHFSLITVQARHWWRFVELMGNPAWSQEPRYRDLKAMGMEYPEEVDDLVEPWVAAHSKWDLWRKCRAAKIPFQAVHTIKDLLESEQLDTRGYWGEIEHPDAGVLRYPGGPFKLSETPWALLRPAPRLGEHNEAVYAGRLGFSRTELADLSRSGVI